MNLRDDMEKKVNDFIFERAKLSDRIALKIYLLLYVEIECINKFKKDIFGKVAPYCCIINSVKSLIVIIFLISFFYIHNLNEI